MKHCQHQYCVTTWYTGKTIVPFNDDRASCSAPDHVCEGPDKSRTQCMRVVLPHLWRRLDQAYWSHQVNIDFYDSLCTSTASNQSVASIVQTEVVLEAGPDEPAFFNGQCI